MESTSTAALKRQAELVEMRARLEKTEVADGTWDWFLDKEILELAKAAEMKNARLAGRTPLRPRLKYLVASILRDERPNINEVI